MLLLIAVVHSFLLLPNIPLCENTVYPVFPQCKCCSVPGVAIINNAMNTCTCLFLCVGSQPDKAYEAQ